MPRLFTLSGARRRHPEVTRWLATHQGALGTMARHWFDVIRSCGDDVCDVMHDGQATACVAGAAFAYVVPFSTHVNVGFFNGATLPDPRRLLQGSGRHMRHVKRAARDAGDDEALVALIHAAYEDIARATEGSGREGA